MVASPITPELVKELEAIQEPQALLAHLIRRFGERAAIGTSGQLTGVVMIHMAVQAGLKPRIFTIDTLRLFAETYALFDLIEDKYGVVVERIQPDPQKLERMVLQHGKHLFFDSKEKQEYCCHVRKVEPNQRVLNTLDIWFSGLRRDQSSQRANTPRFEIITHGPDQRPILKVAPLLDWNEAQLRAYCEQHDVPVHPLLEWEQGGWRYESLGCRICTTPIGPHEPRRAGRWRWFNQKSADENKECGIHTFQQKEPEQDT